MGKAPSSHSVLNVISKFWHHTFYGPGLLRNMHMRFIFPRNKLVYTSCCDRYESWSWYCSFWILQKHCVRSYRVCFSWWCDFHWTHAEATSGETRWDWVGRNTNQPLTILKLSTWTLKLKNTAKNFSASGRKINATWTTSCMNLAP